ncbi:MAG: Gfo/Idh/MocA family oxidoreductase [Planctomycetaceae bacterium]|nr:Gfo/Idh/MocA family oxidoreductase [Planctomycetaceae bacterium]
MHLTSEQRLIGKQNFCATIGSDLVPRPQSESLRAFLKKGNAQELTSGNGLGAAYFGYGTVDRPVRVAVLGTGDEGSVLIGAINPKYVQVVAIADIRPFNQHRAFHGDVDSDTTIKVRQGLMSVYGWETEEEARKNVRVYGDYRELLEKEKENTDEDTRVEAVIIGLPLFLHAPAAIEAMKAGFHVLTEKLMGHTVACCKEMGRAAEKYKKHLATGHQRHYNILYDHAVKLLQSGVLGDLHYIRAQWHRNNKPGADSWQPPLPDGIKKENSKIEKDLKSLEGKLAALLNEPPAVQKTKENEINLTKKKVAQKKAQLMDGVLAKGGEALGFKFKSAEEYGYETEKFNGTYDRPAGEELIRWRLFDRTSAGLMAELGSHQLDAASIFIAATHGGKKQYPLAVSATATRSLFPADAKEGVLDRDADDHVHCVFDYAGPGYDPTGEDPLGRQRKITVAYSSINGNGFGGYGETVFGTKGTLVLETEKEAMLYRGAEVEKKTVVVKKKNAQGEYLDLDLSETGDLLSEAIGLQAIFGDVSRGYCEEIEHWAYCIRENPEAEEGKPCPRCVPKVALADAVIALTTNISAARGETVQLKTEWFEIDKDDTPETDLLQAASGKPDLAKYGA